MLLHLRKRCLYCFMVFAEMLPKMTEIPHGCGQRTSTDSSCARMHAFLPPSAATRWRYVVRSCRELHYAYQRPLSFKNFYFPLFEYANVLSIVIQSHLASTPSCCCPILVSLHLSVSFSCKQKQKKKHVKWPQFLPTGLLLCEHVAIFALPGDYTFLQGLPSLLKHSPLREQRTHIGTQNHTQGRLLKLLQYLAGAP